MKTKTWEERFDEQNFTDAWAEDESNRIKQFISDLKAQTREETIREVEEKEIEIQNILEPYFVVLDGRDNEPAQETIIEISKKILDILNKLKK